MSPRVSVGVVAALAAITTWALAAPEEAGAQVAFAASGDGSGAMLTCHQECRQLYCGGGWVGLGAAGGPYPNVCSLDGCPSDHQCTAQDDALPQAAVLEVAAAVQAVETSADAEALVRTYGAQLLFNGSRDMVVVMAGCTPSPALLVHVDEDVSSYLNGGTMTALATYLATELSTDRATDADVAQTSGGEEHGR